jgi:hypothetical protein
MILNDDKQVDFGNAEALEILGCHSRDELETGLSKILVGVGDAFDRACGKIGAPVRIEVHSAGEPKPRCILCINSTKSARAGLYYCKMETCCVVLRPPFEMRLKCGL